MEVDEDEEREDISDNDGNDKINIISLTQAKKYAVALHHFVTDNMSQPNILQLEDSSYKMMNAVRRMVDCNTNHQTSILDHFTVQDSNMEE